MNDRPAYLPDKAVNVKARFFRDQALFLRDNPFRGVRGFATANIALAYPNTPPPYESTVRRYPCPLIEQAPEYGRSACDRLRHRHLDGFSVDITRE